MGNFDAYLMGLDDDLHEAYLPGGSAVPHFEEVYNAIIETNIEHAAQLYLDAPVRSDDDYDDLDDEELDDEDSKGQMKGSAIADPFVEQPYNMVITSIKEEDSLAFTDDELWQFPTRDVDPPGPGMIAQLTLASGGHHNVVAGATGYVKLVRVWTKTGANGEVMELFDGYLSLEVVFDWSLRFKGHGTTETHGLSFWAVRAKKDENGKEIGLSSQRDVSPQCGY
jgi:hypothetical protein